MSPFSFLRRWVSSTDSPPKMSVVMVLNLTRGRKRALTLSLLSTPSKKQSTSQQSRSSLLSRLPLEIRTQIWTECLSGMLLRLTLYACQLQQWQEWHVGYPNQWHPAAIRYGTCEGSLLALSLTCRRVYSETIGILYSGNTLSFTLPEIVIQMSLLLLPQRIASIQSVHFVWWLEAPPLPGTPQHRQWVSFWHALATMPGLRKLRVDLEDPTAAWHEEWVQTQLLECIDTFQPAHVLTLFLPWYLNVAELPQKAYRVSRLRENPE